MNLQMGDAAPYIEPEATEVMLGTRKHNGGALADLFQAIARSTACSSRVFYGLLAWANLNAHMPLNARILEDCRRDRLVDG